MMLNPRVNAELLLGDRQVSLAEEGIDLAVRIGEIGDSADIARNMGAVRRVLVAAPSYLDAHGVPATPADLARHRLIAFTSVASATHWRFGGDDEPVAINPQYVTNSADAAIWHALHGGGIAIVLSYQVADLIKSSALAVVLQGYEPPPLPVKFVYSSSRLLSLKVRAFIDHAAATRNWMFLDI
jgi:DNA-binding transcriptional LysR family regulator